MSTKTAKRRNLTSREKRERTAIRKELRAEGLLPPVKKPLNRKKFCSEADAILDSSGFELDVYIRWALGEMINHKKYPEMTLTSEAVGAAKVIKLAHARMEFEKEKEGAYKVGELYEAVKEIYNA